MIRNPLYSAVARPARADLCRVTEGIAASLRHFSTAQRLQQENDSSSRGNGDGNNRDGSNNPDSKRTRAAAAFDELLSTATNTGSLSSGGPIPPLVSRGASPIAPPRSVVPGSGDTRGPNIIRVPSLPSRGGREEGGGRGGPNIIRGGFRGRVRGSFADRRATASDFSGQGPASDSSERPDRRPVYWGIVRGNHPENEARRGMRFRGRGGGGGGGNRGSRVGGGGRGGGRRRGARRGQDGDRKDEKEEGQQDDWEDPKVQEWREDREMGAPLVFNPSMTLDTLAGYGPAMATSGTPQAVGETAMRQARILGGGMPYDEHMMLEADEVRQRYRDGEGVFFPSQRAKDLTLAHHRKHHRAFETPPPETRDAVLEAAVLGRYDGPAFAPAGDTLATVRNYVRRDGTWNADASRRIEAKIQSLLAQNTASAPAGRSAKARQ
ncbi:hypothetical protein F4809DRAFT_382386 [Biscogniauxia mediterranea]|nr:hypothetical protein F4809DRAFT_382386 [Biscogniauxia mediterranea]